jgi:hypothetical protein
VDIPELEVEQWLSGAYDDLSTKLREQIEAIDELYLLDEMEWDFEDVEGHCSVRREKISIIEEYLAGGLRLDPMLSLSRTALRALARARGFELDWRDKRREEYYAEHGNETSIFICRPEEVDDLLTNDANRDYFRDEVWIDTLDERPPIPYLVLDIEKLNDLREERDSAPENFGEPRED